MGAYRDFLSRSTTAPAWLQRAFGSAYLAALGDTVDMLNDRVRKAIKARFPDFAPYDALAAIGEERGILRGPNEDAYQYRLRLKNAWTAWQFAGSAYGLLSAMAAAGYTGAYLEIAQARQYALDTSGNLVTTSNPGAWSMTVQNDWSRFAVLFDPPPQAIYPSNVLVSETSAAATTLKTIIDKWRPGHATCDRIVIVTNGLIYGYPPTQVWGAGTGNWGSAAVTTWTIP